MLQDKRVRLLSPPRGKIGNQGQDLGLRQGRHQDFFSRDPRGVFFRSSPATRSTAWA